jgi:hypothetical protein
VLELGKSLSSAAESRRIVIKGTSACTLKQPVDFRRTNRAIEGAWLIKGESSYMDQAIGEVVKRIFENDIDGARHAMKKLPRQEKALSSHYILQQCIDEENIGTEQANLRSIGKKKRAHDR